MISKRPQDEPLIWLRVTGFDQFCAFGFVNFNSVQHLCVQVINIQQRTSLLVFDVDKAFLLWHRIYLYAKNSLSPKRKQFVVLFQKRRRQTRLKP
jgi:hypothetical protein